jgi:ATP-dependent DNA helicase UvrD/PcrA
MTQPTPSQEKILSDLNEGQRQAVVHGHGPQMVVAGAGTGKTAVITRRIAHLVTAKVCSAKEILALTFTDKAAEEMESRVDVLVPYGFTDSTICTFHAFGDRVLREQGILLGMNPNYKVLSTAEQLIFLRENLFELPLKKLRPLSDPTRHLQMILNVISRAKDEDVTPVDYLNYCEELEKRNQEQASEADTAIWQKQSELADVYACYQKFLLEKGLVDFGDLITLTLRVFRENPDVLEEYRRRFQYIMVDEFQDTNAAQFELLRLLAGDNGNITVVGDDDQSIYKFRGAAISNILQFSHYYPETRLVVLKNNYRSTQTILDAAYRLVQHNNPGRLEVQQNIDKRLLATKAGDKPVVYQGFDTVSAEADWVAKELAIRKQEQNMVWSDCAVLVRTNRQADAFVRAFNAKGIPCRFRGDQGLYRQSEVKICIAFLRVLADPYAPLPIHELATSELYDLPAHELATITAESKKRHWPLKICLEKYCQGEIPGLTQTGTQSAGRLLDDIDSYLKIAKAHSTGQVLYRFLTESGLLAKYTEASSLESDVRIKNVAKFFSVVQRYENIAASDRVVHFVAHLDMLEAVGDDPSSSEAEVDFDAVDVLTVHRAKGLEFEVVYIVGLAANRFPGINRNSGLSLPLELAKEDMPEGDPFLSEERRLFYVAMTRAKQELILTGARDYGGTRAYKPSRFIMEALELPGLDSKQWQTSALERIKTHAPQPTTPLQPLEPLSDQETLSLSFYQIDDYLTCPLKYKYIHMLKIPVLPHHAILYGKALHTAITEYYRRRMAHASVNEEKVIEVFLDTWVNEGFISREHEEIRQNAGIQALKLFVSNDTVNPIIPKYIEKSFAFTLGRNKIVGRIDRVDLDNTGEVAIVDFKSSEVHEQKEADKKAKNSLQLKIYALAWLHLEKKLPQRLELYFLDSGLVGRTRLEPDQVLKVETQIHEVAEHIRQREFSPKPSVWVCNYCPYRTICPHATL